MGVVEREEVGEERGVWDVGEWRLGACVDARRHRPFVVPRRCWVVGSKRKWRRWRAAMIGES